MSAVADLAHRVRRVLPLRFRRLAPRQLVDLGALVALPPGYHPTNPAILPLGGEGFLVCVRGVNYVLESEGSLTPRLTAGTRRHSLNRCLLLDRALRPLRFLPGRAGRSAPSPAPA